MRLRNLALLAALVIASSLSCGDDGDTSSPALPRPYEVVPESGRVQINGLEGPVDVVRDKHGMVHIHATSLEDALRVQGYQLARDRTVQLELIRRSATGRLAELLGDDFPNFIDEDIAMRTVGLARTAQKMADALSPDVRALVDAYADGISQFQARVQSGDEPLPPGMIGIPRTAFEPFTAADVIASARFLAMQLSYDAPKEIRDTEFIEKARATFSPAATDPEYAKRAGMLVDVVRFAPVEPVTTIPGFPNDVENTMSLPSAPPRKARPVPFRADARALAATRAFRAALAGTRVFAGGRTESIGSNNWVVGPSKSASGHAMVASDPHLPLTAPSIFWLTHITVDAPEPENRLDFAGVAFPGAPGVILGFNQEVGWGSTTANFDVTDVYQETLTPGRDGVVFRGQNVPFEKIRETILVAGRAPIEYDVLVVPHHGPVVPTITSEHTIAPLGDKVLSVKWTGHEATKDLDAVFGLLRAKDVEDARAALRHFAVGAQNWVVADTKGNIFYTSQAIVPKRDKSAFTWDPATFTGTIPCFVLPGDGSAEWTGGRLEEAFIPHVKNPPEGYVATANNEQVGSTLDNDPTNDTLPNGEPMYMAAWHDLGFRQHRIKQRIEAIPKLSLDDMQRIQADIRSAAGAKLSPLLLAALERAAEEAAAPGTHPDLQPVVASPRYAAAPIAEIRDLLARWGTEADFEAASGLDADNAPTTDPKQLMASRATAIFNVWMARVFQIVFGDEIKALGGQFPFDPRRALFALLLPDPASLKTFDAGLGDSILFDDLDTPGVTETRNERMLTALLDSVDFLRTRLGADTNGWLWGKLHTLRFESIVALWGHLSIPPTSDAKFPNGFPRGGDGLNVDVAPHPIPMTFDATTSFSYTHGPAQRFVIEMDPAGVKARNALPGGNVWDSSSPHFRDQAELWRRNETFDVPFHTGDVIANAEDRIVYESP